MNSVFLWPGVGSFGPGGFSPIGPVLLPNGTAAAPSLAFVSDSDTGLFRLTTDFLGISSGGVGYWAFASDASLRFDSAGFIGFAPASDLTVSPDTRIQRYDANVAGMASGDSFRIPSNGRLQFNANSNVIERLSATALFFGNADSGTGFGLDFTTNGTAHVVTGAGGDTAVVRASSFKAGASGTSGVSAGPFTTITSITVVGGIVTALTGS
jgi:hypothetical protein